MSDVIPVGSTVELDEIVLTKISDEGCVSEWKSNDGHTFVVSDRKIHEFKCFTNLRLAQ